MWISWIYSIMGSRHMHFAVWGSEPQHALRVGLLLRACISTVTIAVLVVEHLQLVATGSRSCVLTSMVASFNFNYPQSTV
ncbi:uncharacterized protein BJX67DRAFT_343397, partial [Aspergillus lucknowensis]